MKTNDFIKNITNLAKIKITDLARENLTNTEKKSALDHAIYDYIERFIEIVPMNFIGRFFVKKILLENVSVLTQAIFDLLKEKIIGVTKENG